MVGDLCLNVELETELPKRLKFISKRSHLGAHLRGSKYRSTWECEAGP